MDVPSNVNDTQLLLALKDHCDESNRVNVNSNSAAGDGTTNNDHSNTSATANAAGQDVSMQGGNGNDTAGNVDNNNNNNATTNNNSTTNNSSTSGAIIGSVYPVEIYSSPVVEGACSAAAGDSDGIGIGGKSFNGGDGHSHSQMNSNIAASANGNGMLYHRNAWAIFESEAAKEKMLENLVRANLDANRHARDSRDVPKILELDVDCSDAYGRYDIDADGHGGTTPVQDGITPISEGGNGGNGVDDAKPVLANTKVPLKRVTVFVGTSPPVQHQQTVVLSAAVSSTKRIPKDCRVAFTIANRLDIARNVPSDLGCQGVLTKLFPTLMHDDGFILGSDDFDLNLGGRFRYSNNDENGQEYKQMIEDALDVTIAYLRRVHLFTFYNGCTFSDTVGGVLGGSHAAGTIHVRLKGADDILKKAREDNADIYDDLPMADNNDNNDNGSDSQMKDDTHDEDKTKGDSTAHSSEAKDMLVMRLDDSIDKVLESITEEMEVSSPFVVNETVDAVASEIESLEEEAKTNWINNHSVIDNDGRARCSFHFCNKLFKDQNFLQKHLLKKHPEFLQAEVAKSHDSYMMNWWDQEEIRPVPDVCIDCGPKFGILLSPVFGAAEPVCQDPEPELWREDQERIRKIEEEEERYRERHAAAEIAQQQRHSNEYYAGGSAEGGGGNGSGGGDTINTPSSNFVDVDDMKDEKVELSFENVNVVAPTSSKSNKKKKKKKKLL